MLNLDDLNVSEYHKKYFKQNVNALASLSFEYFFRRNYNVCGDTIVKSPKSIIAHNRVKVFYKFIAYFYTIFTVELNLTHGLF